VERDTRITEAKIFLLERALQVPNRRVFENHGMGASDVGAAFVCSSSHLLPPSTFVFEKTISHLCGTHMFYGAVHHVGVQVRVVEVQGHTGAVKILDRRDISCTDLCRAGRITSDLPPEADAHFFFKERYFKSGILVV
jgi:hypothetical protein